MSSQLDAIKARAEVATDGPWLVPIGVMESYGYALITSMKGELVAEVDILHDGEFIAHARQDIPALVAAVEAALELHKPWKIHDCDCDYHTAESECDSEFMYTVCRECCTSNGYHTEECASEHIHGPTHPICPTVTAIHQALGEGEK